MEFQPMSPEEIQRTMQFLLNQQAQAAADSDRLAVKTERIADGLIGLTSIVGRVTEALGELASAQRHTDEQLKKTDEQLRENREQQKATESNLNVVIQMFERHLREDHQKGSST